MNYETAIELAHQRMREIGKCIHEYHIEPVCIVGKDEEIRSKEIILKAYNEYYYLVDYKNYLDFIILSDTGYFNANDYTENTVQEFTGLIRIILIRKGGLELPEIQPFKPIDFIKVTIH